MVTVQHRRHAGERARGHLGDARSRHGRRQHPQALRHR
jgi:hypothetical protein